MEWSRVAVDFSSFGIDVGDTILVGRFKNKKAVVKGFETDDKNQPVVITNKGKYKLYSFRVEKFL